MMRSGQTDDVFEANRPSVLHRHDDAWFSEFIIFASHLNLYTLHKEPFTAFIRNACTKISDGSYARKVNIYSYDSDYTEEQES